MPKLDLVTLGCLDPEAQRDFYCSKLGMRDFGDFVVGYDSEREAKLKFVPCGSAYQPQPNDLYWKIALAVPNIDLAYRQLRDHGVEVGQPHQFQDVGYLAHLKDPEGYTIELIDHWFEGQRPASDPDESLFGGGAHFNLLTLRASDMQPVHDLCEKLGMAHIVVQPVTTHGFTLHFYSYASQQPPNPDLESIENRPWLYQRPETVLEIQHVPSLKTPRLPADDEAGYQSAGIAGLELVPVSNPLKLGST